LHPKAQVFTKRVCVTDRGKYSIILGGNTPFYILKQAGITTVTCSLNICPGVESQSRENTNLQNELITFAKIYIKLYKANKLLPTHKTPHLPQSCKSSFKTADRT
jgi:hypothetical protein